MGTKSAAEQFRRMTGIDKPDEIDNPVDPDDQLKSTEDDDRVSQEELEKIEKAASNPSAPKKTAKKTAKKAPAKKSAAKKKS